MQFVMNLKMFKSYSELSAFRIYLSFSIAAGAIPPYLEMMQETSPPVRQHVAAENIFFNPKGGHFWQGPQQESHRIIIFNCFFRYLRLYVKGPEAKDSLVA